MIFEAFVDFIDCIWKIDFLKLVFKKRLISRFIMIFIVVIAFFTVHSLPLLDVSVQPNHSSG